MNLMDYVKTEIRNRLNEITDDVINGSCTDYAAYRYQCGQAMGMVMAEDIIKQAERKARAAEDGELEQE